MIEHSYTKVIKYLIKSDYSGYDPYDGANSMLKWLNGNKYTRVISTYFNKFSPVNIRPLLQIPRSKQNQALAFIARAMLNQKDLYYSEILEISEHLIKDSLINDYGYHCWDAHGFPIQLRTGYKPVGITDIVGTEAIGRLFYELDARKNDDRYREICISIRDIIQNELSVQWNDRCYYRYTPNTEKNKWCYNASIIAAVYVAKISEYSGVEYDKEFVDKAVRGVISKQKSDGAWYYSIDNKSGYEKKQIDFHQGFILDALLEYMEIIGYNEPFLSSYQRGLDFYYKKQFLPNGQSIYRYPKKWPVNIHNQAQGIITFTRAASAGFGNHYLDFARIIAEWTIKNMQGPDGHFYYHKYPLFTNKIPYIRWNDASMAYALSVYLINTEKENKHTGISRASRSLSSV